MPINTAEPKPVTTFDHHFAKESAPVLYHYCNAQTLLAILETNTIRFSDANMMNDSQEGRYGYGLFEEAAERLLKRSETNSALDGLSVDFFVKVDEYLSPKQLHGHPVLACFSKNPDVLGQWRAYADNGQGWAIGFRAEALQALPVMLLEVLYDREQQLVEVEQFLAGAFMLCKQLPTDPSSELAKHIPLFASMMLAYKHPSFQDEQEVRALHELRVNLQGEGPALFDEGGVSEGENVEPVPVRYRADGPSIISYIDLPLRQIDNSPINELWFGPRNENGPGNALFPLRHFGHGDVRMKRSQSPYRG